MDRQPHRRRRSSSPSPSTSSSSSSSSSTSRRQRMRRPTSLRRKSVVVADHHHRSSSSSSRRSHDDNAIDGATGGRSSNSHPDHHRGAEQRRPRSSSRSCSRNSTSKTPQQLRRANSPTPAPSTSAPPQRRQTICVSSPSVTSAPTPTPTPTSYSSTRSGSEYSARAANYVDRILNESQLIITSASTTPRARVRRSSTMDCASIALPIARGDSGGGERAVGGGGNYHHSSSSGGCSSRDRGGESSLSLPRGTLPARRQHSSRHSMSLLLSSISNNSNVDRRLSSSSSSFDMLDERRNVRRASSSSTTTDERPRRTPSQDSRTSLHSSMPLISERRLTDFDRRRRTSTSRSSSGGGGGNGGDHHPGRRRQSCSTERATPITRRITTTISSSASVEVGMTRYQRSLTDANASFKREDAFAIHRTSAEMSRLRRERSLSQEPRHHHRRRPSSDSRTSPSISLRSSNSLDGIGTRRMITGSSTVSTSYTPKHTISNHRSNQPQISSSSSVPRKSRSQSQDRFHGMTRRSSRSQSQEKCGGMTRRSFRSQSPDRCGGMTRRSSRSQSQERCGDVPQRSSRSQSRDRCAGSTTTTTRGSTTLPSSNSSSNSHQKQHPPPPPPPPPRRVSTSTADSIASERLLRLSQKIVSMKESRRSSSDTPSYVSISTQSETTGTTSPDSSHSTGGTFRNTPASAGTVPMPRPRDDPPLPPPRFTRRASSGRDVMLSSLESPKLMSSSCPTLAIVPTDDEKLGSNRPKKVINSNRKCTQKVSRMNYTDPFGNAGLYTGEVDEKSCPHGHGQMRYDNGAYFEGSWVYGCKNDNVVGPKNTNEISTMGTTTTANDGFGNSQMILATVPPAVICPTNSNDSKSNKLLNKNTCSKKVSKMAYTDPFGDAGLYTGEVDDESRPHGKGKMKYDNGIYFEGTWVYGCKNDSMGLKNNGISTMGGASTMSYVQQNGSTRERILSGFTSWKGKKKADSTGNGEKGRFVYGMDWVDPAGLGGKYTGRVDDGDVPDGKGVMRYHFGLIAEGDWIKGVLNNGAGAGVNPIMAGNAAMPGAMSVAPGMSVVGGGGGAMSIVSGLGMMSIGGGGGAMMGMGSYTTTPSVAADVYNRMVNPYSNMVAVIPSTPMVPVGNPLGIMGNQGGYFPQNQMTHPQVPSGPAMDVTPQPS